MPTTNYTPYAQNRLKVQFSEEGLQKTKLSVPVHFKKDSFLFVKDQDHPTYSPSTLENEIWHLDMPKVILKRFWLQLHSRRNTVLVNKTPTEDGSYYWVVMDFKIKFNDSGKTMIFMARKILPSKDSIREIDGLYHKLLSIEKTMGVEVSEKFLHQFLKEKGKSFEEFMKESCLFEVQDILNFSS